MLVLYGGNDATHPRDELVAWMVQKHARTTEPVLVAWGTPHSEGSVADRVKKEIECADKAIAIVTKDERSEYGAPNVLEEIGRWLQARGGRTLCVIRQAGTQINSNAAGLIYLLFESRIREVFDDLRDFLADDVHTNDIPPPRAPGTRNDPPIGPPLQHRAAKKFPIRIVVAAGIGAAVASIAVLIATRGDTPVAKLQPVVAVPGSCPAGMMYVAAGTFQMGSPKGVGEDNEHPQHVVKLPAYCIDRTEVTVNAYRTCVEAKGCSASLLTVKSSEYSEDDVKLWSKYCNRDDRLDHPINCVDWYQAAAYCKWAGKRLPTEEEWEYAARGSDGRVYPWWGNEKPSAKLLNACGSECVAMQNRDQWKAVDVEPSMYNASDGWDSTAPVGSFLAGASPFGVLDMAGNVWEWTADLYSAYPGSAATNPPDAKSSPHYVVRGGGWHNGEASYVRAASRYSSDPSFRTRSLGFRCARDLRAGA